MKANIGVFFGGSSVEHEVAIISAVQAMNYINREKYNVVPVYITKTGEMYWGEDLLEIEEYRDIPTLIKKCKKVVLEATGGECYLKTEGSFLKAPQKILINIAFPIVHGTNCEDGSLQGFFETHRLVYIGPDVVSSAVGMDKAFFKTIMKEAGLPVLDGVTFRAREWFEDGEKIAQKLDEKIGYPLIVKPANLGSSVGISKVSTKAELGDAVDLACSFAEKILVEPAVEHLREINCSVLGDSDECEASVLEEPFMNDEILSYEDKYMSGGKGGSKGMASVSRKCPAELDEEKAEEIREISKKAFKTLGASGVVRIDYLLDTADNNRVYINEINTIPGSLSFYLWEASGLKYPDMIERLIEIAYKRARVKSSSMFTIETNLLSSAKSFGTKGAKGSKM